MSEIENTAEDENVVPEDDTTAGESSAAPERDEPTSHEAAKYRRRLRAAETERDALAARVQSYQTGEAERLAAGPGKLRDATDLWRVSELAALLDDAGELDPGKVSAAVDALLVDKPHYGEPVPPADNLDLGTRGGIPDLKPRTSWADVINTGT